MLTLYYAPATCALASHLALAHAGAKFDLVRIDFSKTEQRSPGYLRINPKGRVPALVTERGILTETPAMLQFIAQSHPEAKLAPIDNWYELAQMNSLNSYLCSTVHVAHAHRMRGHRWADEPAAWEAMKRKVPQSVGEAFGLIESEFLRGPWVLGERFSVSDYYLLTLARWLEADGADLTRLPRVLEHRSRMLQLPLVDRIIHEEES
jgi:glutathione S-transferase